jgi:predicted AAA+ superfamily ATPase
MNRSDDGTFHWPAAPTSDQQLVDWASKGREKYPLILDGSAKKRDEARESIIVSGFPGVGKTYLYKIYPDDIIDSDSSSFDKAEFPGNYVTHIQQLLEINPVGKIILCSSHNSVRAELKKREMNFVLVHPSRHLKEHYLERYRKRGSSPEFVEMMDTNWDSFIDSCQKDPIEIKVPLATSDEYIVDILPYVFWVSSKVMRNLR